jgi:hypothetical protein
LSAIPAFSSPASPTTSGSTKPTSVASSQTPTAARAAERFFGDAPLPLDYLPNANGALDVDIGKLVLPNKVVLKKVVMLARLSPQQIDIPKAAFQLGNGQFDGSARVDNRFELKWPKPDHDW